MKLNSKLFLFVAVLAAALLPHTAFADAVTLSLNAPVQSVTTAGGTIIFSGTVTNTGSATEYFNADSYSLSLNANAYTFNDDGFFNNLFSLDPSQSYTGELFRIVVNGGTNSGNYVGSYSLLGGTSGDPNEQNLLASVRFQTNVTPAAAAATPEPSSLLLLGTGLLGGVGMLRRRIRN